jgi:predicted secreted protein/ribosomal protein S18 acetylase RimI-like enzyme
MVRLRPMMEEEFPAFRKLGVEDNAQQRATALDRPIEQERERAERDFAELLPAGVRTPKQHLWCVEDAAGAVVGYLWVEVNTDSRRAFIYYILMEPAQRGRGYGRQTLELLEAELRPLGITHIGLNVFSPNPAAHLYEQVGYRTVSRTMLKALASSGSPDPEPPVFSAASRPITVRAGEQFKIALPSNATTGYAWRLGAAPEARVLRQIAHEYAPEEPITIGSGGTEVWTFAAVAPGQTTLVFRYVGPSGETPHDQQETFPVTVRE